MRTLRPTYRITRADQHLGRALLAFALVAGCAHDRTCGATWSAGRGGHLSCAPPAVAPYCDPVLRFPDLSGAVRRGDLASLRSWLESGGTPNLVAPDGNPLLFVAAAAGNVDAMTLLLGAGADSAAVDAVGAGLLHHAALAPDSTLIDRLLDGAIQVGLPPADARDSFGHTPLMEAVAAGRLQAARALLAHGASPTAADQAGETPLLFLCREGPPHSPALLRLLLDTGADPAAAGPDGRTPLLLALENGHADLARELLALDIDSHPRPEAPETDDEPTATTRPATWTGALATGPDDAATYVMAAAAGALPDLVAQLAATVSGGLSQADARGWTPLRHAACGGRREAERDSLAVALLRFHPPAADECPALLQCGVRNDLPLSIAALRTTCAEVPPAEDLLVDAARHCASELTAVLLDELAPHAGVSNGFGTVSSDAGREGPGVRAGSYASGCSDLRFAVCGLQSAVPAGLPNRAGPPSAALERALLEASRQGCVPVVRELLACGVSPVCLDASGRTPLELALTGAEFLAPGFDSRSAFPDPPSPGPPSV
ncbi:MAG: hypothetical protein FJ109_17495, partial [Deltaproteobacteria bacterium]|nr:hypothetical protein [Deltaproteobacteria bacterium]